MPADTPRFPDPSEAPTSEIRGVGGQDEPVTTRSASNAVAAWLRDVARRALIVVARDTTSSAGRRSLLVVAPHPDDETIGCGARILASSRLGTPVTVVVVTDGSGSHGQDGVDRNALRARRQTELGQAARRLGVHDDAVITLGYPDGGVSDYVAEIAVHLGRLIDTVRPDEVYVTCAAESHPDHAACGQAAAMAVEQSSSRPRLLEYPVWLWSDWPVSRGRGRHGLRTLLSCLFRRSVEMVRLRPHAEQKLAALNSYRSQLGEQRLTQGAVHYTSQPGTVALPTTVVRRAVTGPELFFTRTAPTRVPQARGRRVRLRDRPRMDTSTVSGPAADGGIASGESALGRRVGKSVLWQAANTSTLRAISFLTGLLLARLVAPHEFGVYTVAYTISTVLGSLISFGFVYAIVREHERTAQIAPTILTLSIATSSLVTVMMVGTAPYLAGFMGAASATNAVRLLSVYVFLAAFTAVPIAVMSRDFMQRQRFIVDSTDLVSSTAVMLVFIGLGHPVIGLALGRVAGQLCVLIAAHIMSPEHYRPGFDVSVVRELLRFGAPLTGSRMIALIIANIDFIIVGHLLGAQQLGYYNLAFNIAGWPLTVFGGILMSVTAPVLSRVRNSPGELSKHLKAGLSGITAASFFVCALLCGLAAPIVDTVYGQRWHEAWGPLVVLSLFGAAQTVLIMFWDLLMSLGMTRRLLAIQIVWIICLAPAMYFGVHAWHIAGAGQAHAVVVLGVVLPAYLITVRSRTPVELKWFWRSVAVPLPAAVVCGVAAFGASRLVDSPYLQLLLGLVAGTSVYALLAGRWLLRVWRELREMYWTNGRSIPVRTGPPPAPRESPDPDRAVALASP